MHNSKEEPQWLQAKVRLPIATPDLRKSKLAQALADGRGYAEARATGHYDVVNTREWRRSSMVAFLRQPGSFLG